jgi:branched-chain amino acid transport system permease protein
VKRYLLTGIVAALVLAYPVLTMEFPVYQRLGALVLLAAIGASAWNIVGGYAGQVSVGHAVFFGFGAYASVVVYTHLGWPPIAGAPLGMALSVGLASIIGVPTLRLSGHYFSMATIAVAELVRVLSSTSDFLGGAQGLGGPALPRSVMDLSFLSAMPYYYIFLVVLAFILWLTWTIERGRMGFYLRAIKDSERAARSLGVSAGRYKLYAYMLSGAFTSLAGSLYLCMFGFVDPESGFGILISVKMLVMAALGGAGQLFGPLVGALILVPLEELSNSYLGGRGGGPPRVV